MSDERPAGKGTFGQRLGRAIGAVLRWLLRLLLALIIGAALGAGIYFGAIFVYQQYIAPVQVHAIRLDLLEARQKQAAEQLTERLDGLQGRVRGLEAQGDQDKQALARLGARVTAAETAQAAQAAALDHLAAIEAELAMLQAALTQIEETHSALYTDVDGLQEGQQAVQAGLGALEEDLGAVQEALDATASSLDAVEAKIDTLSEEASQQGEVLAALQERLSGEKAPESLLRSLQVLRAMELLTRSRLLLVQNNVGLARTDLAAARELMIELQSTVPADQQDATEEVIARLGIALDALPGSPVTAADALEGAWQLLLAGLPSGTAAGAEAAATVAPAEGTPAVEVSPTVEGTPTAEATPTAEVTPEATPTPTPQS
ncbi:MAG TPA: hypothetical protein VM366_02260 [Anaerolineae bacterium]|nr:hypothetical protein [Anaerolineae bacterium]